MQEWQQGTKCDISLSCNPDGSSIGLRKAKTPGIQGVFEQKVKEGKNKPQALVCVARRLVRIIYGMMKPGRNTGHMKRLTTRTDFIFWKQSNGR